MQLCTPCDYCTHGPNYCVVRISENADLSILYRLAEKPEEGKLDGWIQANWMDLNSADLIYCRTGIKHDLTRITCFVLQLYVSTERSLDICRLC